ncbi:MAG: hypothetical protein Q4C89_12675 [Deinococcus sp.]|uniref:hypothetical protein n=1 Tax=Deinococcus sp. TaxID=47478 RepID=UPI0026DB0B7D|nr:hypothetical protein [Deinococcus sp.]MDO4246870.1 hypothetical protein [Deinococcus sp.]
MIAVLILAVIFGGIALITYVDNTTKAQKRQALAAAPAVAPLPVAAAENEAAPETLILALPDPARAQAWQLLCLIHDGLQAGTLTDTRARYLLTQTRQSYLPDTLRAYLNLTDGARRHLTAQGQTPEQLLDEQLSLMTSGIREALRHDHAAADHLLTQGRFLRERFGTGELAEGPRV